MRRPATLVLWTFTLLGVMVSAGCADSTASGSPTSLPPLPSSTPSALVTSTAGTSTAGAAPSVSAVLTVPPAAREHTVAGAEAFVRHYFSVLEHAFVTGDVGPYLAASSTDCESCQYQAKVLREEYREGKSYKGGDFILLAVASPADQVSTSVLVLVSLSRKPLIELSKSGQPISTLAPEGVGSYAFQVRWQNDGWQIGNYSFLGTVEDVAS